MDEGDDLCCNNAFASKFIGCEYILLYARNLDEADFKCIKAIFSSNLIYIPPSKADSNVVVLSVRNAMGIYVALCLFLTILTITASYLWMRRLLRSARVP